MFQAPWLPEFTLSLNDYKMFEQFVSIWIVLNSTQYCLSTHLQLLPLLQGHKKDAKPDEAIEAYKYTFSQPGAFTPPLNYYRAIMRNPARSPKSDPIEVPCLLIWVSCTAKWINSYLGSSDQMGGLHLKINFVCWWGVHACTAIHQFNP